MKNIPKKMYVFSLSLLRKCLRKEKMLRNTPRTPVVIGIILPIPCGHRMLWRKRVKRKIEERARNIIRNCKKI
jgi:hypothetical protein